MLRSKNVALARSEMRRMLPDAVLSEVGRLDPAAIAQVRQEAWPDIRDADELQDALQTMIVFPEPPCASPAAQGDAIIAGGLDPLDETCRNSTATWPAFFANLVASSRAARALVGDRCYWVVPERATTFAAMFPNAVFESPLPEVEVQKLSRVDALSASATGWMQHAGPVTSSELGAFLGIAASDIESTLLRLEGNGSILRGSFTNSAVEAVEWCDRRLLARIHRLTLGALRSLIQPATAAQFMRWLLRWQHVAPSTQVLGERGTLEVLQQLQGFEAPANSWEHHILARRVANYDPKVLDQLCLTGAVGWGRLSPHPATFEGANSISRRVVPTSVAPIAFFSYAKTPNG